MGGRGMSWRRLAKGEQIIYGGSGGSGGAAEKIPAAEFQTISGNRVSRGATLARVEGMIAQHTYETGLIIDEQGFVLAAYKGDESSVNFGSEGYLVRGNTMTHNHPSGTAVFSVADIRSTGIMGGVGVRATTRTNGTASLTKNSNRPNWGGLANAYDSFLTGGKTVSQAQDWLRENAPKYGLKFTLEA